MLFRCHIGGCADPGADLGRQRRFNLGHPEVGDLHPLVISNHDVGGLDVAMHHLVAVRVFERLENLAHDAHDALQAEFLAGVEIFLQFLPADVFHRDEGHVFILAVVVN